MSTPGLQDVFPIIMHPFHRLTCCFAKQYVVLLKQQVYTLTENEKIVLGVDHDLFLCV